IHQHLQSGDALKIRGPKNFFRLQLESDNYLLIAGGIGISPILSMAQQLKKTEKNYTFVYCGRHREALAYLDEVTNYVEEVDVYICSEGRRANLEAILKKQARGTHIYACGPEPMLDALENLAANYQLDLTFELFSSASG